MSSRCATGEVQGQLYVYHTINISHNLRNTLFHNKVTITNMATMRNFELYLTNCSWSLYELMEIMHINESLNYRLKHMKEPTQREVLLTTNQPTKPDQTKPSLTNQLHAAEFFLKS